MAIEGKNAGIRQSYPDDFIRNSLPPVENWPDFINISPALNGDTLNVATELLDKAVHGGYMEKPAILTFGKNWSYGEIYEAANKLANFLVEECALVPGNRVLIRAANSPWAVISWFAVQKAGGVAVTTMAMLRDKEIAAILELAAIQIALCDHKYADELEKAANSIRPSLRRHYFGEGGGLETAVALKASEFTNYPARPADIAILAFTSGTTGAPKGVMHSHRDIMSVCRSYCDHCLTPAEDDILLGTPPLAFVYGIGALLFFPFHARASVVLLENNARKHLVKAIRKFQATILFTVPTAYKVLLEHLEECDLSSLRKCVSAGEALPAQIAERWRQATGIRLMDGIGSTEMLHSFISAAEDTPFGSLGRPVTGYEVRILDDSGKDVPVGRDGRLAVRGPTGCRYLNGIRQKDYVRDGWNITGDIASMDDNGNVWFKSRADGMIVSAGYNIAGPDVEQTLLKHEAVADCAVIGTPDEKRGKIVTAFIVLKNGYSADSALAESLRSFAKKTAAPYKYPRKIHFLPTLPRTNTGKIQYYKLLEIYTE